MKMDRLGLPAGGAKVSGTVNFHDGRFGSDRTTWDNLNGLPLVG